MLMDKKVLKKLRDGCLEQGIAMIHEELNKAIGSAIVLATFSDRVICVDENMRIFAVKRSDGMVEDIAVAGVDRDAVVGASLHELATDILNGCNVRDRLYEMSGLVKKDVSYFLSDILIEVDQLQRKPSAWLSYYNEHMEEVRSALRGEIRTIEGRVPRTRFGKLSASRASECGSMLRESVNILTELMSQIIDRCDKVVFDGNDDGFDAIKRSLISEANDLCQSLGRAKKLILETVPGNVAIMHDALSAKIKTMLVMSEYLCGLGSTESGVSND